MSRLNALFRPLLCLPLLMGLGACKGSEEGVPAPPAPQPGDAAPGAPPPKGSEAAKTPPPADAPLSRDPMSFDPKAIYLQALSPTSGEGARALMDGDRGTAFKPGVKDGVDEGVLLRFETPQKVSGVEILPCEDKGAPEFVLYANGGIANGPMEGDRARRVAKIVGTGAAMDVNSLFVKFLDEAVCVSELRVLGEGGAALAVRPPRAAPGKVTASSTLSPEDAYHVAFLFDQRTDFGWVEGAKSTGEGERVTLTFDAPQTIHALELWNGYQRSADHFKKNARAKGVRIEADGKPALMLTLKDTQGAQTIQLESPITATRIDLILDSAYKGSRYEDLVLSELRFRDVHGPFTVATQDMATRAAVLKAAVNNTALEDFVDRRFTSVCEEDPRYDGVSEQSVKFRTNHTFVLYELQESAEAESVVRQVTDGAWVVGTGGAKDAVIKLFARSHRTSESFVPYGDPETRDTTKIAGGDLKITAVESLGPEGLKATLERWKKGGVEPYVYACEAIEAFEADPAKGLSSLVSRDAYIIEGKALTQIVWEAAKG